MKDTKRISSIPPYMFAGLDRLKSELCSKGCDIIDLSVGDPDLPVPEFIVDSLKEVLGDRRYNKYPPYEGTMEFREAVAAYYKRRFEVSLDPESEVVALIGSKEGIAHLGLALIDPGDYCLVPNPGYPVYQSSTVIAGGKPVTMPLLEENNFLADVGLIHREIAGKAKLMYINYPNNPTGSACDFSYMENTVRFALDNGIVLCNDGAYNEIVFDRSNHVSILSVDGARETVVEFGTLSKSYNMTGWRIGYAVGNREVLKKLMLVKSNVDSGQFGAIQHAAACALNQGDWYIEHITEVYKRRRDFACELLKKFGIQYVIPKGTFYLWFKVPEGYTSRRFAEMLIKKYNIIVTPGSAFGYFGEGFCRIALTVDISDLKRAAERIM